MSLLPGTPPLRALDLVLTTRCNMRCEYCFESAAEQRSMSWEVAAAALDVALRSQAPSVSIVFFGGEPLIEFETIRRSIAYAASHSSLGRLRFSVVTNGMLLGPESIRLFAAHGVATQISFDGVREAQDRRSRGTFDRLDRLLARLRADHSDFFEKHVSVAITVSPRTVQYLARSVSYLLDRGVRDVAIGADMGSDPAWTELKIGALDRALASVYLTAKRHYRRTGRLPIALFRKGDPQCEVPPESQGVCGVGRGEHLAVDVDGTLVCCGVFAPSIRATPHSALAASQASLSGGNARSTDVENAMAAIQGRARAHRLFGARIEKHSAIARCAACRYVRSCRVCPLATVLIPGNDDPTRIPSFACAFNRVRMKYWERFPASRPLSKGSRRRRRARLRRELAEFAESAGPASTTPAQRS